MLCRGYITRQRLKKDPQLDAAAARIQSVWRRHQGRKSGLLRIRKMQQARDARFLQLQDNLVRWRLPPSSCHDRATFLHPLYCTTRAPHPGLLPRPHAPSCSLLTPPSFLSSSCPSTLPQPLPLHPSPASNPLPPSLPPRTTVMISCCLLSFPDRDVTISDYAVCMRSSLHMNVACCNRSLYYRQFAQRQ